MAAKECGELISFGVNVVSLHKVSPVALDGEGTEVRRHSYSSDEKLFRRQMIHGLANGMET